MNQIRAHLGISVGSLQYEGGGAEFAIWRATVDDGSIVAIKAPRRETFATPNDPEADARRILWQEAALTRHLRDRGVPVARSYGLVTGTECPFLVQEYIDHDHEQSWEPNADLVSVLVGIHRQVAPFPLVAHAGEGFAEAISSRMVRRSAWLSEHTGKRVIVPEGHVILSVLRRHQFRASLLHLDIRPPNLLRRNGLVQAVIDWSNAMNGDPSMEFARIAEWWTEPSELRQSYESVLGHIETPDVVDMIYRLDAALVLGILFTAEFPDRKRATNALKRIERLGETLCSMVHG